MYRSPLVYQLEDPREFSIEPLTDSQRPGVQTALPSAADARWARLLQLIARNRLNILFFVIMSLSCAVRWSG